MVTFGCLVRQARVTKAKASIGFPTQRMAWEPARSRRGLTKVKVVVAFLTQRNLPVQSRPMVSKVKVLVGY